MKEPLFFHLLRPSGVGKWTKLDALQRFFHRFLIVIFISPDADKPACLSMRAARIENVLDTYTRSFGIFV